MKEFSTPLELKKLKVYPLAQRKSLSTLEAAEMIMLQLVFYRVYGD